MKGKDENYIYTNQDRYSDTVLSLKKVMKQYLWYNFVYLKMCVCVLYKMKCLEGYSPKVSVSSSEGCDLRNWESTGDLVKESSTFYAVCIFHNRKSITYRYVKKKKRIDW